MNAQGKKKAIAFWLSLAISIGLLAFLLGDLDWELFFTEVKKADLRFLPLLFILNALPLAMRAVRNKLLLPDTPPPTVRSLSDALIVGTLASCVLPLRAGEVIRPWLIQRWLGIRFSTALASVVTERVFDVIAMLILLFLALSEAPNVPPFVALGAKSLGLLTVTIIVIMVVAYIKPRVVLSLISAVLGSVLKKYPAIAQRITLMVDEFLLGLRGIASGKELVLVLAWSLAIWCEYALTFQVGLWMFGAETSIWAGVTVCVFVALAVAAPSAPGFIGTFQAGCVAALVGLYHFTREFALAYSLVVHVINLLTIIIIGLAVLHLRHLNFKDVTTHKTA